MRGSVPSTSSAVRMPFSTRFLARAIELICSLYVISAEPDGAEMHFCVPAMQAESFHSSTLTGAPPSVATVSTISRAP